MSRRNQALLALLTGAAVLFCVLQFWLLPAREARLAAYERDQRDALTHDITAVEKYRGPYVGDASNLGNLFYKLPLGDLPMKFQIDSERCAVTVSYQETVWSVGEEKVRRDLLYNAVAAMASIDNLAEITYEFSGNTFLFQREALEQALGSPLSGLLSREVWEEKVQGQLGSEEFVGQFYP